MNINAAFPSNYLKAADLTGKSFRLRMKTIAQENIGDDRRLVAYFDKTEKGLVLNKTNAFAIAAAYGEDTDHWIGRDLELYPDSTMYQGRPTPCIRVRPFYPAANGTAGLGAPVSHAPAPRQPAYTPPAPPATSEPFGGGDMPDDEIPF